MVLLTLLIRLGCRVKREIRDYRPVHIDMNYE